jgi:hypothetical protein
MLSKRVKSNGLLDLFALIDFPSLLGLGLGSTKAGESNNLAASADSASGLTSTTLESVSISGGGASGLTMDQLVEFSYAELAKATDNFSLAYKIGEGGYGAVYHAELRGEVCSHTHILSS